MTEDPRENNDDERRGERVARRAVRRSRTPSSGPSPRRSVRNRRPSPRAGLAAALLFQIGAAHLAASFQIAEPATAPSSKEWPPEKLLTKPPVVTSSDATRPRRRRRPGIRPLKRRSPGSPQGVAETAVAAPRRRARESAGGEAPRRGGGTGKICRASASAGASRVRSQARLKPIRSRPRPREEGRGAVIGAPACEALDAGALRLGAAGRRRRLGRRARERASVACAACLRWPSSWSWSRRLSNSKRPRLALGRAPSRTAASSGALRSVRPRTPRSGESEAVVTAGGLRSAFYEGGAERERQACWMPSRRDVDVRPIFAIYWSGPHVRRRASCESAANRGLAN